MSITLNRIEPLEMCFEVGSGRCFQAKTLVEQEMIRLSASLRSRHAWWSKFRDDTILKRWRDEALEQATLMEEPHVDYVLKELDGYANLRDEQSGAEVACYDGIWMSDRLVSSSLKARLIAGVAKLENVPEFEKDWHPRSDGQVLDLVHPSLYPVVYGRTLWYPEGCIDRDANKLEPIPPPELPKSDWIFSRHHYTFHVSQKFQWLPTDFVVSQDGKSVKTLSYINNLDPTEHEILHSTIEEIIAAYIPMFERVLTDIPEIDVIPQRTVDGYSYDEDYKPRPEYKIGDDDYECSEAYKEWEDGRPIYTPEVDHEYVSGSLEQRKTKYSLAGRTIQVIVKLANIHLTPEKPQYPGGSWHIEGMSNEAIAASGIYYYETENITESHLLFRASVYTSSAYEHNDERGCRLTWGISRDDVCANELGAVVTVKDRCIAFPNTYQHRVSPFELADETKPGHRKILALFLVDPAVHRPSTTRVPPQQHEWRSTAISSNPKLRAAFDGLSTEIIDRIDFLADGTMTRSEADAYRLEMMDERTAFVEANNEHVFNDQFNMCEH